MLLPLTFNLDQPEKYILSIRLSANAFMFSISEPGNRKNYSLQDTEFLPGTSLMDNLKKLVFDMNFLTFQYKSTNVIIVTPEYDIVPGHYIDNAGLADIYKFVHYERRGHVIADPNKKQGNHTVYSIGKDLYEFLSRNLCNPQFYCHATLLMDYFGLQNNDNATSPKIYLYFHDKIMDVLCYDGAKLVCCQSYSDQSHSNQAYYVLKLWETCSLDQLKAKLYLAGEVDNSLVKILQKYIKNIDHTGPLSEVYLWHEDVQKAPLDLLALLI